MSSYQNTDQIIVELRERVIQLERQRSSTNNMLRRIGPRIVPMYSERNGHEWVDHIHVYSEQPEPEYDRAAEHIREAFRTGARWEENMRRAREGVTITTKYPQTDKLEVHQLSDWELQRPDPYAWHAGPEQEGESYQERMERAERELYEAQARANREMERIMKETRAAIERLPGADTPLRPDKVQDVFDLGSVTKTPRERDALKRYIQELELHVAKLEWAIQPLAEMLPGVERTNILAEQDEHIIFGVGGPSPGGEPVYLRLGALKMAARLLDGRRWVGVMADQYEEPAYYSCVDFGNEQEANGQEPEPVAKPTVKSWQYQEAGEITVSVYMDDEHIKDLAYEILLRQKDQAPT